MLLKRSGVVSKKALVIVGGLLVAAVVWIVFTFVVHEVPDCALTRTRMRVTQRRILAYYSSNRKPPSSLADLPPGNQGVDNSTTDAWGKDIGYRVIGDRVVLESMGYDGKPGGVGQDQDIALVFKPADSEMLEPFSATLPAKENRSGEPGK